MTETIISPHPNLNGYWRVRQLRIRVLFFASYRELAGSGETWLEVEEGSRLGDLTQEVNDRYQGIRDRALVAVNGRYVEDDPILIEGDEVAFFPPVSGG